MATKKLVEKMKLRTGLRAAVLNAPDGYLKGLEPLPEGVELEETIDGDYDWLQLFVKHRRELESLVSNAVKALRPESLLWVTFPKGSSKIQTDLTRDHGWESLEGSDLKWVNLISVDEKWSAFCLRPYSAGEERKSFR